MRMTTHRRAILTLLQKAEHPLSAENIFNELGPALMDLSTVYRALEVLYANGYLAKSTVESTSYYHVNQKHHHHFIMCLNCKKMVELDCHLDHQISKMEEESNFQIVQHDLTFYGYCPACQNISINA